MDRENSGLIFDIGRFRNADGPGIRTIIFFKGCPMHCKWCSNPFGLNQTQQLTVNRDRCTGCGRCVSICKQTVNSISNGKVSVNFKQCTLCGSCIAQCQISCRTISGRFYTARELFEEVYKDIAFYRKNEGGVTLSGGEALLQHEVAIEVLRLCKANYLHTCLETCGFTKWEILQAAAQYCNVIFIDLKHMDSKRHQELTGVSNELILSNIQKLCEWSADQSCRVILRIPVIPGYTDEEENLIKAAEFIARLAGAPEVNLLPYHSLGESKYGMIGMEYPLTIPFMLSNKDPVMLNAKKIFETHTAGNRVSIGGDAVSN
jgi:pyruvate formate lyase activating enzyme